MHRRAREVPIDASSEMLPVEPVSTLKLQHLIQIRCFLNDPQDQLERLQGAYRRALADIDTMQLRRNKVFKTELLCSAHRNETTLYGLVIGIALLFNQLLQIVGRDKAGLAESSAWMHSEVVTTAADIQQYQPHGTGYFLAALISAWAAAPDQFSRDKVEETITTYSQDRRDMSWKDIAGWLHHRYQVLRRKASSTPGHEFLFSEETPPDFNSSCFIQ